MAVKKIPSKRQKAAPETPPAALQAADADKAGDACPVVGIGASAGGLEAITDLLAHLPEASGCSFVFVQHLDPKHTSILTDLLGRATSMPVMQATEGMRVQADHVYVIPPNTNMRLMGGTLHLELRAPAQHHMPIDYFFRSLADEQGSNAIGVILSGTASDGTLGLKAIKAAGGITVAQDERSAKFDGMPRSAIAAGCVDFVLPPAEIALELARLCQHPYVSRRTDSGEAAGAEGDFTEIFALLRNASGVDFTHYKPGTVRRRVQRRMALCKIEEPAHYVRYLKENRPELEALFQDILINVTSFFREPVTLDTLKQKVLPVIYEGRGPEDSIRVWVPGCSTGEEAYTAAMILLEHMRSANLDFPVQIFGTDLSEAALERARAGVYPESIAADVSTERLRRFFTKVNGSYQVSRLVRDTCIFARQNVTKDPPFSRLDLVICRNVLIYLGPVLQRKVMRMFHYALKPSGYLVLGVSESAGAANELFEPIDKQHRIYTRKPVPATIGVEPESYEESRVPIPSRKPVELDFGIDLHRRIDELIVSRYSPPGVVVNRELGVLQFCGQTAPYLEHVAGEANLSLLRMARGGLALEIRKLIQQADKKLDIVRSSVIPVATPHDVRQLRLAVTPIRTRDAADRLYLVMFEEQAAPVAPPKKGAPSPERAPATPRRVRELEQELSATRQYLQSVIEEQEAVTEELKSANEEIQSSNEELQSTNEELLTAKEELQSTNEELTTVNEEMQGRNAELSQVNNDLINLLSSVNIPIIMMGNDLRIRRFTPQAEKLLNLLPGDVGRPISDFRLKINMPDLVHICREIVDQLSPLEREVQDKDGRVYSMWIRPYRTAENRIDGVVLSLFDITERRQAAEVRYRRLFESARDGVLIAGADTGEIVDVNPFISKLFGYPRQDLIGRAFWEAGLFQASGLDQHALDTLLERDGVQCTTFMTASSGERIEVEVNANAYLEGDHRMVQFNVRDLSARRQMEERLRRHEEQARQALQLDSMDRLAGALAQEFNRLLGSIRTSCDRLKQELDAGHPALQPAEEISRAGERAGLLTRQLATLGRPEAAETSIDLNEVVRDVREMADAVLPPGVTLELVAAPDLGQVRADRARMEQIVLNLLINARDSMPGGGRIVLETANADVDEAFASRHPAVAAGRYVVLTVRNSDSGANTEVPAVLSKPFLTLRANPAGTSLGLGVIYGIVRQSGGYVWAYSELGVGTTVSVYLPREE